MSYNPNMGKKDGKPKDKRPLESDVVANMIALCNRYPVKLCRNLVGRFMTMHRTWVTTGFGRGSGDFIGHKTIIITPRMVGMKIAQFVMVEMKRPGEEPDPHQEQVLQEAADAGCLVLWADSPEEAFRDLFK